MHFYRCLNLYFLAGTLREAKWLIFLWILLSNFLPWSSLYPIVPPDITSSPKVPEPSKLSHLHIHSLFCTHTCWIISLFVSQTLISPSPEILWVPLLIVCVSSLEWNTDRHRGSHSGAHSGVPRAWKTYSDCPWISVELIIWSLNQARMHSLVHTGLALEL